MSVFDASDHNVVETDEVFCEALTVAPIYAIDGIVKGLLSDVGGATSE